MWCQNLLHLGLSSIQFAVAKLSCGVLYVGRSQQDVTLVCETLYILYSDGCEWLSAGEGGKDLHADHLTHRNMPIQSNQGISIAPPTSRPVTQQGYDDDDDDDPVPTAVVSITVRLNTQFISRHFLKSADDMCGRTHTLKPSLPLVYFGLHSA